MSEMDVLREMEKRGTGGLLYFEFNREAIRWAIDTIERLEKDHYALRVEINRLMDVIRCRDWKIGDLKSEIEKLKKPPTITCWYPSFTRKPPPTKTRWLHEFGGF